MIIARYIGKELMRSMVAVTCIMVFIFACNDLIRYLHYIASGKYAAWVLLHVIALQIPILVALLMPLGFFLGLLLSFARLYSDSEMTVLGACGYSQARLLRLTILFAVVVAIVAGVLSLWIKPIMTYRSNQLLAHAKAASIVSMIRPGRFQTTQNGKRVYYVHDLSHNHKRLENLFFAEQTQKGHWQIMVAQSGQVKQRHGRHYLITHKGHLYQGQPGQASLKQVDYKRYDLALDNHRSIKAHYGVESRSTAHLIHHLHKADYMAALQWRLSVPIMVVILTLIGYPLSYIQPRQSRYARMLPGILIYVAYANLMFVARGWLENGLVPVWLGLWWVHVIFLILGLILLRRRFSSRRFKQRYVQQG